MAAPELDEKMLEEWQQESGRYSAADANRLCDVINALRATRQELALEKDTFARLLDLAKGRVTELEQQLASARESIEFEKAIANKQIKEFQRDRERIEELNNLLQFGFDYIRAHASVNEVSGTTKDWLERSRAALAKEPTK